MKQSKKKNGKFRDIVHRFLKNKASVIGLVLLVIIILLAVFANAIMPYDKAIALNPSQLLKKPSLEHLFGTDNYGRDMFARVAHGAKYTLLIGVFCSVMALIFGGFLGASSCLIGGAYDFVIMRISDAVSALPTVLLSIVIVTALGPSLENLLVAMIISNIPKFIRITRSAVLSYVDMDFVEASRACGAGQMYVLFKHIIPNAIGPVIVYTTTCISTLILQAAGLSYMGLGVQPPAPEWGSMLSSLKEYFLPAPYLMLFPGLAIILSALAFNLMGDGLRDALDPKLKN